MVSSFGYKEEQNVKQVPDESNNPTVQGKLFKFYMSFNWIQKQIANDFSLGLKKAAAYEFWPLVCSSDNLKVFLTYNTQEEIDRVLGSCRPIWINMVRTKLDTLGQIGEAIENWMNLISDHVYSNSLHPNMISPREDSKLIEKLESSFYHSLTIDPLGERNAEYLRAAFYDGDGICFYINQEPMSIVQAIYNVFSNHTNSSIRDNFLVYLRKNNSNLLTKLYYVQSTCKELEANPIDMSGKPVLPSENEHNAPSRKDFLDSMLEYMKFNEQVPECNWRDATRVKWLLQVFSPQSEDFESVNDAIKSLFEKCLEKYDKIERNAVARFIEEYGDADRNNARILMNALIIFMELTLKLGENESSVKLTDLTNQRRDPSFILSLIDRARQESKGDKIQSLIDSERGPCAAILDRDIYQIEGDELSIAFDFYSHLSSIEGIRNVLKNNWPVIMKYSLAWRVCESFRLLPIDRRVLDSKLS